MTISQLINKEFGGERDLSGIGGVETGQDAAEFLLLGANSVQVPLLCHLPQSAYISVNTGHAHAARLWISPFACWRLLRAFCSGAGGCLHELCAACGMCRHVRMGVGAGREIRLVNASRFLQIPHGTVRRMRARHVTVHCPMQVCTGVMVHGYSLVKKLCAELQVSTPCCTAFCCRGFCLPALQIAEVVSIVAQ